MCGNRRRAVAGQQPSRPDQLETLTPRTLHESLRELLICQQRFVDRRNPARYASFPPAIQAGKSGLRSYIFKAL
jgi:hypothetical protein